jgi:hypothetical protein
LENCHARDLHQADQGFRFEEIREAHRVMGAGEARGKMVVIQA